MSGKPVNLNRNRKDKARAEKRTRADENATKFGRTKAEKTREAAEIKTLRAKLDAHKRER